MDKIGIIMSKKVEYYRPPIPKSLAEVIEDLFVERKDIKKMYDGNKAKFVEAAIRDKLEYYSRQKYQQKIRQLGSVEEIESLGPISKRVLESPTGELIDQLKNINLWDLMSPKAEQMLEQKIQERKRKEKVE